MARCIPAPQDCGSSQLVRRACTPVVLMVLSWVGAIATTLLKVVEVGVTDGAWGCLRCFLLVWGEPAAAVEVLLCLPAEAATSLAYAWALKFARRCAILMSGNLSACAASVGDRDTPAHITRCRSPRTLAISSHALSRVVAGALTKSTLATHLL